jgi:GMP synthase-like glutamine amidotransferase
VHDHATHPWLAPERAMVAAAVAAGLPVLGVGLGAQQLALALGADVVALPAPEVGIGQIELTEAGRRDPVFGPEYGGLGITTVPGVHRHLDTFSLPAGSVHLAATRACPHQAFRIGDQAYGLQFHVEVGPDQAAEWAPPWPGVTLSDAGLHRAATVGRRLVTRYLAVAARPTRVAATPAPARGGRA